MLVVAVIHNEGKNEGNGDIEQKEGPGLSRISFLTWLDAYQEPFLHPSLRSFLLPYELIASMVLKSVRGWVALTLGSDRGLRGGSDDIEHEGRRFE